MKKIIENLGKKLKYCICFLLKSCCNKDREEQGAENCTFGSKSVYKMGLMQDEQEFHSFFGEISR